MPTRSLFLFWLGAVGTLAVSIAPREDRWRWRLALWVTSAVLGMIV